jgi:glycosyltransferase involved in cell wall biosynthesis
MIHFFLTFSKDAEDSPFGQRLAELKLLYKIIAGQVQHRFRHKAWMVFVGRPQTAVFAVRAAFQSLVIERPEPKTVVVWTHIEALIVGLMRRIFRRTDTQIVLVGFILTKRSGRLNNWARDIYFRIVFSVVQLAIVHSSLESARYSVLFKGCRARFAYIPWSSHIEGLGALIDRSSTSRDDKAADVLCAGRSGRDYPTLFKAFAETNRRVKIICDLNAALQGCITAPNIEVLDKCYDDDYVMELSRARCVVIPLGVGDISAGQMVLLQAMEMGKPIVMTRTATTVDYITHEFDALLVDPGDVAGLRSAVERLLSDHELSDRLAKNANFTFNSRFTVPAFVTSLVKEIQLQNPLAGRTSR